MIKILEEHDLNAFKDYCRKHKYAHDESYLYEEDLDEFDIKTNPTVLLMVGESITGCISIMLDDYFVRGHKTRIRIFHCEQEDRRQYKELLESLMDLPWTKVYDVKTIEMFMPNKQPSIIKMMNGFNFDYYRTSYVMVRKNKEKVSPKFPEGFMLKPYEEGQASIYASIRNEAFKTLKGSETPLTEEQVIKYAGESYVLKDGLQILWHGQKPMGIVCMMEEEDESGKYSFVAPIALLPEYHGRGLGSALLNAGIWIGQENGYNDCMLSVNAENEQALGLYKKSGFELDMAVSCLQKNIE